MRAPAAGLALAALLSWAGPAAGQRTLLDALVGRVDDGVVTWSQVLQEGRVRALTEDGEVEPRAEAVRISLVRERLMAAEAAKLRLPVTEAEVARSVAELLGDSPDLGKRLAAAGLEEGEVADRARRRLLVRRFVELRRDMTFVPEAEVRTVYRRNPEVWGGRELHDVRDELRAYLTERKLREELSRWFDRQVAEGRVQLIDLPEFP
ncbi:MAG: hypothetical protein ACYDA8_07380 [Deferrisomatales bacterium]